MMTYKNYRLSTLPLLALSILLMVIGCSRDVEELEPATFSTNGDVFIDGFSAGLQYAVFAGANPTAFDVDSKEKYAGPESMRFDVPNDGDPQGSYAGGAFFTTVGRDLTGYDALTFWAKASQSASIDVIGFGTDLGENKYVATLNGTPVTTKWKKYFIPIPDPSKLTEEKGMLYYAASPENGKGYTFWLDEVKFEKLGTIAHPKPAILERQDQVIPAEAGDRLPIGGTFVEFNLPSGLDQRVDASPAYFSWSSSNTAIAIVNELGVVAVQDSGTATITAKLLDLDAKGSLTVQGFGTLPGPQTAAPVPMVSADSVISLFSNAYTNVPVDTWDTGWLNSNADVEDIQIDGDDVKRYKNLNFVGIEFASQTVDITSMNRFHMDIWTPDPTELPASFKVLLIDFGADGVFDGGDDVSHELSFTSPTLKTGEWVSLDVPLSSFAGLTTRAHLAQMVLSGELPNVYVDNVYFYIGEGGNTGTGPTEPAPTPTQSASDVISIFSDAYTNVDGTDFYPDWGQLTVVSELPIAGNNTLLYSGLNYQGIVLGSNLDVSGMEFLHIDFWTANSAALNAFLISTGPIETAFALTVPTSGWASVDIPLSSFSPVDLADLIQFKFDGSGDIYLDNLFFYKGGGSGTGPTEPAPTPTQSAADVISIFSDAYTNEAGTDFYPDWGQETVVSEVPVAGNNTLLYSGLNFQGIMLGSNLNVSGMEFLHIDYWTSNSTDLNAYLISPGPTETTSALSVPTSGWASVDIPLSSFSPVDLADLIQFKFDGNGDIYLDNLYFYKDGGTGSGPTQPAPTPTQDAADVISVFSDAYTNIDGTDFNPDWGQSTMVSFEDIAGNNTMKYANFNYQGTQFASEVNASSMGFMHIDMWTSDATDVQATPISVASGEMLTSLTPIIPGQWNSYDIPLSVFTDAGVSLNDLHQLKFDGQAGTTPSTIYLDNIYFYKVGGSATEPTQAAPTPTQAPGDVVSVFSDTYTNIDGTDFYPDWGQETMVSEVSVAGNNTLLYSGLNYQGIVLGSSQDVSGMTNLHIDFWTANSTALSTFLISSGPVEAAFALTVPTSGWGSVDISLSSFSPVDLADVFQLKFEGNGDIYLDNIYFYKTSTTGYTTDLPIDFEPSGHGANWTWTVFENDDNPPLEIVANPDNSGANTSATVAKFTARVTGNPWAGCESQHGADIGSFSFNADNKIVRIMVYKSVISDVGIKFAESSGEAQPEIKVANTKINEWEELTFDFSGSIGAGITGIIDQIIVFPDFDLAGRTTENVVYFDNIRFSAN
jgi:hypothetical protein